MKRAAAINPAPARGRKKMRTRHPKLSAEGSKLQIEVPTATVNAIISGQGSGKFRQPKNRSIHDNGSLDVPLPNQARRQNAMGQGQSELFVEQDTPGRLVLTFGLATRQNNQTSNFASSPMRAS